MPRPKSPLASTALILEKLKEHADGITSKALSKIIGRDIGARLSKLFDYGVIERRPHPRPGTSSNKEFIYSTKLPRVTAPATAASIPAGAAQESIEP